MENARSLWLANEAPAEALERSGRPAHQLQMCMDFVSKYVHMHSVSTSRDGRAHLPFWPTCSWLYYDFRLYCVENFTDLIPVLSTFRSGMKEIFKTISLPRGNADLKGCSTCTRNVLLYEKLVRSGDFDDAAALRAVQKDHERVAFEARHSYHNRRLFASLNPRQGWFLVQVRK